jgi:hypothetical protein
MNVLVNGASICRGAGSWPYYLQEKSQTKFDLVNLAQAGAGNYYIHDSTVSEISKRPYNLVMVMWSYPERFDFRVKNIMAFQDTEYNSWHSLRQNDWPSKKIHPINDQDYVEDNWVFSCGYLNLRLRQLDTSLAKVVKEYYRVVGNREFMSTTLIKIIGLQNTLKALGIPYVFMNYRPLLKTKEFDHLYSIIDWSNFYDGPYLQHLAKEYNDFDDTLHPKTTSQLAYTNHVYEFLLKKQLIK